MPRKVSHKLGISPGSLVHIGEQYRHPVAVNIIDYDEQNYQEHKVENIRDCLAFKDRPTVTWINVDGLHQINIIEELGNQYQLHPLLLEDILNTTHRPKVEEFDDCIFFTFKMLQLDSKQRIDSEQVSIVFGKNYVLSFQERPGDIFEPIRNRIKAGKGRLRKRRVDYLVYCLIDAVVDNYFEIIENIEEQIGRLGDEIASTPRGTTPQTVQNLKNDLIFLKRSITPLREAVGLLEKTDSQLLDSRTAQFLRDVYDHILQILDSLDSSRDILNSLLDTYLSMLSHTMNKVMKVLTIIATIFIPLTFIAGIYGMNFKFMPELEYTWGYPAVLVVMGILGVWMLRYFHKHKWI